MGIRHGACSLLSALSKMTLPRIIPFAYIIISRIFRRSQIRSAPEDSPRILLQSYYRTPPLSHFRHRYSTCAFQPMIFSSGPRRVTRDCRCTHQRELSAPKRIRLKIISTLRRIFLVGAMMKAKRGILRNTLRWCGLLHRPPFWFLIFLAWHSG